LTELIPPRLSEKGLAEITERFNIANSSELANLLRIHNKPERSLKQFFQENVPWRFVPTVTNPSG
jgi:hypothetical protein